MARGSSQRMKTQEKKKPIGEKYGYHSADLVRKVHHNAVLIIVVGFYFQKSALKKRSHSFYQVSSVHILKPEDAKDFRHRTSVLRKSRIEVRYNYPHIDTELLLNYMARLQVSDKYLDYGDIYFSKNNWKVTKFGASRMKKREKRIKTYNEPIYSPHTYRAYDDEVRWSPSGEFEDREISETLAGGLERIVWASIGYGSLKKEARGFVVIRSMTDLYSTLEGEIIDDETTRILSSSNALKQLIVLIQNRNMKITGDKAGWAREAFRKKADEFGFVLDANLILQDSSFCSNLTRRIGMVGK